MINLSLIILIHMFFSMFILIHHDLVDILQVIFAVILSFISIELDVYSGGQVEFGECDISNELPSVRVEFYC